MVWKASTWARGVKRVVVGDTLPSPLIPLMSSLTSRISSSFFSSYRRGSLCFYQRIVPHSFLLLHRKDSTVVQIASPPLSCGNSPSSRSTIATTRRSTIGVRRISFNFSTPSAPRSLEATGASGGSTTGDGSTVIPSHSMKRSRATGSHTDLTPTRFMPALCTPCTCTSHRFPALLCASRSFSGRSNIYRDYGRKEVGRRLSPSSSSSSASVFGGRENKEVVSCALFQQEALRNAKKAAEEIRGNVGKRCEYLVGSITDTEDHQVHHRITSSLPSPSPSFTDTHKGTEGKYLGDETAAKSTTNDNSPMSQRTRAQVSSSTKSNHNSRGKEKIKEHPKVGWFSQWWNASEEQWAQRGVGLAVMGVGAGLVWYFTSATYTLTTDPSPYKNTMFQHFPCDYAVIENKWTGYSKVISLEEEEMEMNHEKPSNNTNVRLDEGSKKGEGSREQVACEALSLSSSSTQKEKLDDSQSSPRPSLSVASSPSCASSSFSSTVLGSSLWDPSGPGVSVCRQRAVISKKISINRLKDRIYCYLQKKDSLVVIPLDKAWMSGGSPSSESHHARASLHHNGKDAQSMANMSKLNRSHTSRSHEEKMVFSVGRDDTSTAGISPTLSSLHKTTTSEQAEKFLLFKGEKAAIGAGQLFRDPLQSSPSPPLAHEGRLVVESVVRPLRTKNGYQKGQLPRYEMTIRTVSKEILRQRYNTYLLEKVGAQREACSFSLSPSHPFQEKITPSPGSLPPSTTTSRSSSSAVGRTHRVFTEELLRQSRILPGRSSEENVTLPELIPDINQFTGEVREEILKRLGKEVLISQFSIHFQNDF